MKNGKKILSVNDVPNEDYTVLYESVVLNKKWCFFEGYENVTHNQNIDWKTLVKHVFSFDDIITFWQFWNNTNYSKFSEIFNNGERIRLYPSFNYSFYESRKRINSINIFVDGIYPAWEDQENKLSYCLTFNYEIKELKDIPSFLVAAENLFLKLILIIIGGTIEGSENVKIIITKDKWNEIY